jgi:nitroimidazol reductase NimA-like FMN-containing flavoprotein (pyridoxamine 5'-phosphate oxidase superfamily)
MMRETPRVCFEVDEYEDGSWRSVIVDGVYEELEPSQAERALALLVQRMAARGGSRRERPRAGGRTPVAFRIRCESATGRAVRRTVRHRALTRIGLALGRRRARLLRRAADRSGAG